jgi:hypothetical protein
MVYQKLTVNTPNVTGQALSIRQRNVGLRCAQPNLRVKTLNKAEQQTRP